MQTLFSSPLVSSAISDGLVEAGLPEDKARAFVKDAAPSFAQCMADKTYDTVSDDTKRVVAKGTNFTIMSDEQTLKNGMQICLLQAAEEHGLL
ncbi:MAG: hypothetical protein IKZ87_00290, partial [Actinomycetaceae bacterium]|nr:hypothetical protein [Actinomycetaceae bacterium]